MTSYLKKIKRKKKVDFMKKMKKTMKQFRKMVMCSACGKTPLPGQKIDDWTLERKNDQITLTCTDCAEGVEA
jgi:transcription elongation factor Elf1